MKVRIARHEDLTGYKTVFVGAFRIGKARVHRRHGRQWVGFIEHGSDGGEASYASLADLRSDAPRVLADMKQKVPCPWDRVELTIAANL